jgi:hypothetical protein
MNTSTVTPEIQRFADGVRAALADLPAEEVDDLTEGLEADLAESLAEDLRRTLPDPVSYAAELRLAAGLPGRASAPEAGRLHGLAAALRDTGDDVVVALRRNPALGSALDLLAELRPAWWIVRAWLATWLVAGFFGMQRGYWFDGLFWVVLLAFLAISVQWGRGRWGFPGLRGLVVVGNVVALVALLPAVAAADGWDGSYLSGFEDGVNGATNDGPDLTGVYLNGAEVTNIFGYDAKGRPLTDVQLFDQDGHPLATSVPGGNGCLDADCTKEGLWVPSTLRNGAVAWNVFPMRMIEAALDDRDSSLQPVRGASPTDRPSPFRKVPALVSPQTVAKAND